MKERFFNKALQRIEQLETKDIRLLFQYLQRENEMLFGVLQVIDEGVLLLDSEQDIIFANRAIYQLFSLDENIELTTLSQCSQELHWHKIMPAEKDDALETIVTLQYPTTKILALYSILKQKSPQNEFDNQWHTMILIKDRTQLEQEKKEEYLQKELKTLKMLSAGIAHEIGNPLNAIAIHLQLLSRQINQPNYQIKQLKHYVQVVEQEVQRLDRIIKEMLGAIRPIRVHPALTDVHAILQRVMDLVALELQQQDIQVKLNLSPSVPPLLLDSDKMQQVFGNLIKNAQEAIINARNKGRSSQQIIIASEVIGNLVYLTITDDGEGMAQEQQQRIFEPFHSTKSQGTGLGLVVVKRILDTLNIGIQVSSTLDKGTIIKLIFSSQKSHYGLIE